MREILFRGKKVNKDKWIYGAPVKGTPEDESEMLIIESVFDCKEYFCRGCNFDPVIPETLGQYTGLTDKNGKKIFEGDILKVVSPNDDEGKPFVTEFFAIVYEEKMRRFVMRSDLGNDDFDYSQDDIKEYKVEVIGNIHDNPRIIGG